MKIQLNPLQTIYNNLSLAKDAYEDELIEICNSIKNRIFEIIGNDDNYKGDIRETVNGGQILRAVKSLIYVDHFESNHTIHMAFDFDNIIRFLFLDEKIEKSDNKVFNRISSIQDEPFSFIKDEAKLELSILLTLWIDHLKSLVKETLYNSAKQCDYLPNRKSIESVKRLKGKKGIRKRDWLNVAC